MKFENTKDVKEILEIIYDMMMSLSVEEKSL